MVKLSNIVYALIAAIAVVVILIYGKAIILPFALAVVVWFLIKVVRNLVRMIKLGRKSPPTWLQNIFSFLLIFSVLGLVSKLLSANIANMYKVLPMYEQNFNMLIDRVNVAFSININDLFNEFIGNFNISGIMTSLFNSISEIFADAFLVLLYTVFLMLEDAMMPLKLKAMISDPDKHQNALALIKKISKSINEYVLLKTIVSLITATVSFIVLLIIGIDFAFFWAFLIFVLNYIPTIGSLVATIFPAAIALFQFGEISSFFVVLGCIGAIQILVGNIIEPRIMGSSLNVSPLVVLISLAFWGSIWGVVGMVLSVPITVILIIMFAQFKATRNIAILLSGNGNV